MRRVVVIGLGGTGGLLVEPLARYLNSSGRCREVLLVDGDSYSPENMARQRLREVDVGRNKAEVHAAHLQSLFPGLSVAARPEFADAGNIEELVSEDEGIFVCVDNHASRKLVCDQARRLRNILVVSVGNELTDGNVQVYWKERGKQKTAPLDRYHQEIRFPTDRNPAELSCEERAARPGGGQTIFANMTAAALALNAFYAATTGRLEYGEAYFDIVTNRVTSVERR